MTFNVDLLDDQINKLNKGIAQSCYKMSIWYKYNSVISQSFPNHSIKVFNVIECAPFESLQVVNHVARHS